MIISAIVAVARNGIIGKDNTLPWRLPADLQHFRKMTTGHHIVLGRKNYQSIGRPLPNRTNIVLSRDPNFVAEGCVILTSIDAAIQFAQNAGETECFIIGGAEIYRQSMSIITRLYLTRVEADFEGDVIMPDLGTGWQEVWKEAHEGDERNPWPYVFLRYERTTA